MQHLFVAVASGQNVANLPPLLELAQPGDLVVWVESPTARREGWSARSEAVLQRRGLHVCEPAIAVAELNNPAELSQACATWCAGQAAALQDRQPVLVMNGGTKLTPIGLWLGFAGTESGSAPGAAPVCAIYGNDRPAEVWLFPAGWSGPHQRLPYVRHTLDLLDILEVSGHAVYPAAKPRRLWPAAELPADIEGEPYGQDPETTHELHRSHANWRGGDENREEFAAPGLREIQHVLGAQRLAAWKQSVFHIHRAMSRWTWPALADRDQEAWQTCGSEDQWVALYSGTRKLLEETRRRLAKDGLVKPANRFGPALERAVARRLWHWLQNTGGQRVVQSLWANVPACRADRPELITAEFDVLLVLKNGILAHVECKTATVSRKDLEARLLNLQTAGSQLAQMAVCAPLFTDFADENWFRMLHRLRLQVENTVRLKFLPLTWPDQPDRYRVEEPDGEQSHACPTLEEALTSFLQPFVPRM